MSLILQWLVLSLAIMIMAWIVPGIVVSNFLTAMLAGVVIALINIFIKPVLLIFFLPINILTLVIFVMVINALLLLFVAYLVPGVTINGFWSAFAGAIILSLLTLAIS
ncbi:phage holin family protein [bacterium]|nr:phage holin family protein [bacterium]